MLKEVESDAIINYKLLRMSRKSCLVSILLLMLCPILGISQDKIVWQMQATTIQTMWAKDVNPENPLPEYPRPQMVRGNWLSMNGLWDYAITPKDAAMPSSYCGKILVPYPLESALSGVKKSLQPSENLWYKRVFAKPTLKEAEHVLLHFGAVDWQATIYVNGKEIGMHNGGYQAFTYDITDALRGGENELIVKVFDPTDQGISPHGKQVLNPGNIYYTASSGIWQTVWLETVPATYIDKLVMTPDVDKGVLNVSVDASEDATVELVASDARMEIARVRGKTGSRLNLPIKNVRLWSPETPFLYNLTVKLIKGGKTIDEVKSYFGMRKIAIQKDEKGVDRIFLNNKPYFNLGTLDQGFWPDGLYTAPTDEALKFDIEAIKAMGFNTIRKHIKIEPARWYYHADRLGVLVWQDFVNPNQALPEGSKQQFEKECMEVISQLSNNPSIIMWVLFNEKWGQYDQERLTKWVKENDSSRLIDGHSGEYLFVNNQLSSPSPNAYVASDVTDVHSYPPPMISTKQPGKAQVCGEFGGVGVPIEGHIWDDLVSGWGYNGILSPMDLKLQYSQMTDSLKSLKQAGLSASIYTQPFDVESEQNGLMTYDRKVLKINIDTLARLNSKLNVNFKRSGRVLGFSYPEYNQQQDYFVLKQQFLSNEKDSSFLRKITIIANEKKDTSVSSKSADLYFDQLKNPYAEVNLKFITRFTSKSNSNNFKFLFKEAETVNRVLGKDEAERVLTRIIEKECIIDKITADNLPDWPTIERNIVDKYGALGRETLLQYQILYSVRTEDWDLLSKSITPWYFEFGRHRKWISWIFLNNIAWAIFQHVKDKESMETALAMSKQSLILNESSPTLDTYACILYKLGYIEDAVKSERKAVSLSNGNGTFADTLEKMQAGKF